jgi:hypothetical protein
MMQVTFPLMVLVNGSCAVISLLVSISSFRNYHPATAAVAIFSCMFNLILAAFWLAGGAQ